MHACSDLFLALAALSCAAPADALVRLPGVPPAARSFASRRLDFFALTSDEDDGLEIDEEFELFSRRPATRLERLTERRRRGDFGEDYGELGDDSPYEPTPSLVPESTLVATLFLSAVALNFLLLGNMFPDASPSGAGSGGSLYVTAALFIALGVWAVSNDRSFPRQEEYDADD